MPLTIAPNTDFTSAASQAAFKTALNTLLNELRTNGMNRAGESMIGALEYAPEATVASAATTDIGAAASNRVQITGTTTITSLGTAINRTRLVRFAGALTLTHNASSLILPGGANIATAASDTVVFQSDGTGNWRCLGYQRADGTPIVNNSLSVASTAEAQAGTDNTKALTPLRLREALNASGSAPIYACRAWVNFNGTGTVAIRASGNVSSITDNGVGDYTINFTTAMPDANYSMAGVSGPRDGANFIGSVTAYPFNVAPAYSSSSIRIGVASGNAGNPTPGSSLFDSSHVNIAIFR